jgi:hypothetical protein
MSGTLEGGKKASLTNKQKYGNDFYRVIGQRGGQKGRTGGFATKIKCSCYVIAGSHYKVQCAGRKGGQISKRPKKSEA